MTTVVDLSKGNTYLAILLVWCMSVFDSKTCAHVEPIRGECMVCHVFLIVKHVPMMSYSCGTPHVVDE